MQPLEPNDALERQITYARPFSGAGLWISSSSLRQDASACFVRHSLFIRFIGSRRDPELQWIGEVRLPLSFDLRSRRILLLTLSVVAFCFVFVRDWRLAFAGGCEVVICWCG